MTLPSLSYMWCQLVGECVCWVELWVKAVMCSMSILLWSAFVLLSKLLSNIVATTTVCRSKSVLSIGDAPIRFDLSSHKLVVFGSCCCSDVQVIDCCQIVNDDRSYWCHSCDGSWMMCKYTARIGTISLWPRGVNVCCAPVSGSIYCSWCLRSLQ